MPRMSGVEATARIRNLGGAKKNVPVIALTGNAMEGGCEKFLVAGMTDYVSKPVNIPDFRALVTRDLTRTPCG